MLVLAIWCLVLQLCYALPQLNVTFSHTAQGASITCSILDLPQDNTYELYGYVILKSNQSHWNTMAEIFRANPTRVHVKDPRLALCEGSVIDIDKGKTHLKITWDLAETSMSGNYRCDAIMKNDDRKVETKVFSKTPLNQYRLVHHGEKNGTFLKISNFTIVTSVRMYSNSSALSTKEKALLGNYMSLQDIDATNPHENISMKCPWHTKTNLKNNFMKRPVTGAISGNTEIEDFKKRGQIYKNQREKRSIDLLTAERNTSDIGGNRSADEFHSPVVSILTRLREIQRGLKVQDQENIEDIITFQNWTDQVNIDRQNTFQALNLIFMYHYYNNMYMRKQIAHLEAKLQSCLNYSESFHNLPNIIYSSVDEFVDQWPRGTYALLKTASGCPLNPTQKWKEGFWQIHTESSFGTNNDTYSENSNLALPIKLVIDNENFMNLTFCVKDTRDDRELPWPKGSYCINRKADCPEGFTAGSIYIDEEDDSSWGTNGGVVPEDVVSRYLTFCCRNDSSPVHSIYLPFSSPFYLYRFGGRCQDVIGMSCTEEYVHIDTENSGNGDQMVFPHADGRVNSVNITLCYYKSFMSNLE